MPDALSFAYEAQTPGGQAIAGTLAAVDLEAARVALQNINLRIISLAALAQPPAAKPLHGSDFLAFNQQLACLTAAGLPVEQGLRLIATDLATGRLAATIREIADDLDRGVPLPDAFARRQNQFPPLYSRLVEAGIKANSLPAMLYGLGRHMELIGRVRAAIWQATAYPLAIFAGLSAVLIFLSMYVLPPFRAIFADFRTKLPLLTELVLDFGPFAGPIILILLILILFTVLLWQILRLTSLKPALVDNLILPIPIIGSLLRANLIARWCDALRLAVEAGLDLPTGITLAGEAVASPRLATESARLVGMLQAGHQLDGYPGSFVLPVTVTTCIHLASQQHDLPASLQALTDMYQHQAEQKLALLPVILTPPLMVIAAVFLGTTIVALFLPLVRLVQGVS